MLPLATATCRCLGLPEGVAWGVHTYPLLDLGGEASQVATTEIASNQGLPPLRVLRRHFGLRARHGGETLEVVSLAGLPLEVGFWATNYLLDRPMQRAVMPAAFFANATRPQRGFQIAVVDSVESPQGRACFVADDGQRRSFGPIVAGLGFVASAGLGDALQLTVRRTDGARATLRLDAREAERLGRVEVPAAHFTPPIRLRADPPLVGLLTERADGGVVLHIPDATYRLASANVLLTLVDGSQVATAVEGEVRRRIGVGQDGRAGHVVDAGAVVWGPFARRLVRPDVLWQLPAGTSKVHLVVRVGLPIASEQAQVVQVEWFEKEVAPDQSVEVMVTPQLAVTRLAASAETPSGLVPLPERIVD